jgi:hypothetical protein
MKLARHVGSISAAVLPGQVMQNHSGGCRHIFTAYNCFALQQARHLMITTCSMFHAAMQLHVDPVHCNARRCWHAMLCYATLLPMDLLVAAENALIPLAVQMHGQCATMLQGPTAAEARPKTATSYVYAVWYAPTHCHSSQSLGWSGSVGTVGTAACRIRCCCPPAWLCCWQLPAEPWGLSS